MKMIFNTINTIEMTVLVFNYSADVSIQLRGMILVDNGAAISGPDPDPRLAPGVIHI